MASNASRSAFTEASLEAMVLGRNVVEVAPEDDVVDDVVVVVVLVEFPTLRSAVWRVLPEVHAVMVCLAILRHMEA